ncbi:hypothetical protein R5P06_03950 [Candidatus Thioglobus autotrophicus]|uniref:toxin-antitoxin system YwqK family antitoxin n=1 Tax=Candidatus Thioglobus autotrophicus TaxID=1705394 RepID=UPI00299F23BB|nr:hypothetical protein [Candidatus Thioglobus autotrophicus]WPE17227.1 hypothetical protein R5P06_03950 [Candidatus Thioglobus autotrophicus]
MIQQKPDVQTIDGITYQLNSDTPYTGKLIMYYDTGEELSEINYVNGKEHGPSISWDENGRKCSESNSKNGMQMGRGK